MLRRGQTCQAQYSLGVRWHWVPLSNIKVDSDRRLSWLDSLNLSVLVRDPPFLYICFIRLVATNDTSKGDQPHVIYGVVGYQSQ